MSDVRLFIAQGPDDVQGPFGVNELRQLWDAGALQPQALYWHRAAPAWRPVTQFRQPTREELRVDPQISTLPEVAGETLLESLGVVHAECVQGVHWGHELLAGLGDLLGGRVENLERLLKGAVSTCTEELRAKGRKLVADAVVGVSYSVSELSGKGSLMLAVVATGTAVRIEERPPPVPLE